MQTPSTQHQIIIGEAAEKLTELEDQSVDLVVTSPPYPMIEMWDDIMADINPEIGTALAKGNSDTAFELMHQTLDAIWAQAYRVLKPGGFACINIGDATRTINDKFALYPNHARIISACLQLGFSNMPNILWRKQTNAPNKFMGSGMLPAGAYVTLEHEWILVFRKEGKRVFKTEAEKQHRRESAFFWEERNVWFSDLWDLKGVKQKIANGESRDRSAAYPFELPYRLINMYSVKGDTVLDPFIGTGTTTLAAMASERNSLGIDVDNAFLPIIAESVNDTTALQLNQQISRRIAAHKTFLQLRALDEKKSAMKHFNVAMNLPVMTSQETEMRLNYVDNIIQRSLTCYETFYRESEKSLDFIAPKKRGLQEVLPF